MRYTHNMKHNLIGTISAVILLLVAAVIIIHAPLTVWLGTVLPDYKLEIKAWKEILLALALVLMVADIARQQRVSEFMRDKFVQLALVYAGLHFALVGLFNTDLQQAGAGLLIDLRFVLYFVLVYLLLRLYPGYAKWFKRVFIGGAVVVLGFTVLQQFVLPRDFLTHIGYSRDTIAPYLLVDDNPAYVRHSSTLRGPNPLGAYAVIVIGLLAAAAARLKFRLRDWVYAALLAAGAGLSLGLSYSRGALIGAGATLIAVPVAVVTKRARWHLVWATALVLIIAGALLFAYRDSNFVANVILHDSPTTGAAIDSNRGHLDSLDRATRDFVRQPLGDGIGSTGSASLLSDKTNIIESQYLFEAHEAGWLGLGLFVWLAVVILTELWRGRQDYWALGVFASGIGLFVIGLFLPVFVDDTVSIIWWGLAGLVLGERNIDGRRKSHQKTA